MIENDEMLCLNYNDSVEGVSIKQIIHQNIIIFYPTETLVVKCLEVKDQR